ncbi:hypothetical protein YC2023_025617 [Brassica napus]
MEEEAVLFEDVLCQISDMIGPEVPSGSGQLSDNNSNRYKDNEVDPFLIPSNYT